jgi:hypothetical protein
MSPPNSRLKSKPSRKPARSRQQAEATCNSEMSVDFQRTARCYIPKDCLKLWFWLRRLCISGHSTQHWSFNFQRCGYVSSLLWLARILNMFIPNWSVRLLTSLPQSFSFGLIFNIWLHTSQFPFFQCDQLSCVLRRVYSRSILLSSNVRTHKYNNKKRRYN